MNRRYPEKNHRRRGTALLEFVMSLPILLLVIAGIFFFGRVMRNQQRLRVADRYVSWRHLHNNQAGTDMGDQEVDDGLNEPDADAEREAFREAYRAVNVVDPTGDRINELLLAWRGDEVGSGYGGWSNETRDDLVVAAEEESGQDAGDLADQSLSDFPEGSQGRVSAEFPQEQEALGRIQGMISSGHQSSGSDNDNGSDLSRRRHHREGRQWRRWEASYLESIRELFLSDFDEANNDIPHETLRRNIEDLYLRRW